MATVNYATIKFKSIKPIHDTVVVCDMDFEERITSSGIVIPYDDMKSSGIRPRWARVYAIGPAQTTVKVGQYVLVSHGRWTRGLRIEDETGEKVIRKVDPNDILAVSDERVEDLTMSDKVL
jgi:co-chaperonin GroES (HSP10)